jgi:hypothetical protein
MVFEVSLEWRNKLSRKEVEKLFKSESFEVYVLKKIHDTDPYWVKDQQQVEVEIEVTEGMKPNQVKVIFFKLAGMEFVEQKIEWVDLEELQHFVEALVLLDGYHYQFTPYEYHVVNS